MPYCIVIDVMNVMSCFCFCQQKITGSLIIIFILYILKCGDFYGKKNS
jgi:hypothetical protein